jgi:hypothetical protein
MIFSIRACRQGIIETISLKSLKAKNVGQERKGLKPAPCA